MVANDREELDRFKRMDPRPYMSAQGYMEDRRDSSRGSTCMRHPITNDKIFIKREARTDHWIYASVRDDRDNGTIIDFIQFRKNISLGALRKELRPWIGQPPVPVPVFTPLVATTKDRGRVEIEFARMRDVESNEYLANERQIPPALLVAERFAGRIRIDARQNTIFPHFDQDGLCGWEIKNRGFKGFASGGSKGLWVSNERDDDARVAFFESAIDALSYAALFSDPHDRTRYVSIGGKLNPRQPELIRAAAERMPANSQIIAAMDSDADGAALAGIVREAVQLSGREDLRFVLEEPFGFKDWNDQLRNRPLPSGHGARGSRLEVG